MFLKQPDGQTPVAPKRGFPDMLLQLVGNGIILNDDLHAVCCGKIKHVSDWMITEDWLRAMLAFGIKYTEKHPPPVNGIQSVFIRPKEREPHGTKT